MKVFTMLFSMALSSSVFANGAIELKSKLDPIKQMHGVFSQKITDKNQQLVQQSSGNFKVKRPGFFHWHTSEPYEQVVIGTPEKVWIYDPDLEQVTINKHEDNQAHNPMGLLTDSAGDIEKLYDISSISEVGSTRFVLLPKQTNHNFVEIEFVFSNTFLDSIHFKDKLQQQTEIRLTQVDQKKAIEDAAFVFDVPPGTDVIEND